MLTHVVRGVFVVIQWIMGKKSFHACALIHKMAAAFRRGISGTKKYANILFGRVVNADIKRQKPRLIFKLAYGCTAGAVITWYIVKSNIAPPINIHHEASKVGLWSSFGWRICTLVSYTCYIYNDCADVCKNEIISMTEWLILKLQMCQYSVCLI